MYKASVSVQTNCLAYSNQYFKLCIVYMRAGCPALVSPVFVGMLILTGLFCSCYSLKQRLIKTVRWKKKCQLQLSKAAMFPSLRDGWMHKYGFSK